MKKKIDQFEIVDHGGHHSQNFEGCGSRSGETNYDDVATGCGISAVEAIEDAIESLAQNDWDVSIIEYDDVEYPGVLSRAEMRADEFHYYVSIRVK